MTALLGRLLNRLGHRLVRWGYALEMRAYYRGVRRFKITFTDSDGKDSARSDGHTNREKS